MEEALRRRQLTLTTLESGYKLCDMDIVGFSLQYELNYTNLVNMLDLGGIPIYSEERSHDDPLVIAGGLGAFSPEPVASFLDLLVLGDGEEILPLLLELYVKTRSSGDYSRRSFLQAATKLAGVYVPQFYNFKYNENGSVFSLTSELVNQTLPLKRAIISDLEMVPASGKPPLPFIETVHDRATLELFRGCSRGCRFCQAGILYRPVRERSVEILEQQAGCLLANTGYDELSLTSLSSMDYTRIDDLTGRLTSHTEMAHVKLALSSLRVDSFSLQVAQKVQQVRRYGLTLAPEAGSQRMRDRINKNLTEEQILDTIGSAFTSGWSGLKLYFMIGLPGEEESDLEGIVTLVKKISSLYSQGRFKGKLRLSISVAPFVPKAHTPFQWEGQIPLAEIARRQAYLKNSLSKIRGVDFATHDRDTSFLEAVFSRGDRRLDKVIVEAWRRGARFDSWSECFHPRIWEESFQACGIDAADYAGRSFAETDILPWDHLDSGVSKKWLLEEKHRAACGEPTPDCRFDVCSECGVCFSYGITPVLAGEVSP